jgi:hypothetical protein
LAVVIGLGAIAVACKGEPDPTPWCSSAPDETVDAGVASGPQPTWFRDVKPIVDAKCIRCHTPGGIGPFSLERWDDVYRRPEVVRSASVSRHMPPWHAARCCTESHGDASLTQNELDTFVRFLDTGAAIGDAREEPPRGSIVGGLSRVDVTVSMPLAYTPAPGEGKTDENRCFLLQWPLDRPMFITGLSPVPGERSIVHHLVVGILDGDSLVEAHELDGAEGRPGFDCMRVRNGIRDFTVLGGGLGGGDYPGGLGRKIEANSTLILNVHYSTASSAPKPDQTKVDFKVDADAQPFLGMAVANLAWLVDDGMRIPKGEKAIFHYEFEPTIFTRNKPVGLRSVTPHMHAFATKIVVRQIHEDGRRECLLEIPKWHFGWEQPFWFAKPKPFDPGDHLYVECHFDNTSGRDIAWGDSNQDMCAAFLNFTGGPP